MIIPQGWDYNFDEESSDDEYKVINKFLASYRNQSIIVADEYRQDFSMVPLEEQKIIFKANDDAWKSISFCRKINYKKKPYGVELNLWCVGHMEADPKCLSIQKFRIISNGKVHYINLNTKEAIKRDWLFNIISIFDEKKLFLPNKHMVRECTGIKHYKNS